ncbi:hypothetical protein FY528_05285 [Hymenobacter lutimineralis]|uniref:PD-(D/E)XK nuclease family protein n=1 Tax=Hymenobacter lutimineralis TaxID=2606448 RepID=A0A5D6VDS0_9BACT|nr:PD-(D/E)XK nuclease family protein [Hymenobacter lutimineralis]TYZ12704.1 hypothetical protein FY528_05285 [Hymenobacter lutimineralis]
MANTTNTPPAELISFLEGYKAFTARFERQRLQNDLITYARLLGGWQVLQSMQRRLQKAAPEYNIFTLLRNLAWDETRLHSPLLADLLNPNGAHGQGHLFYEALLQQLQALGISAAAYRGRDAHFYEVATEVPTGDGFIDVLLTYRGPDTCFAIAIENKIYAVDQPRQLARYQAYLDRHFPTQSLLLYLTPWPRQPDPGSLTPEEARVLHNADKLRCITYNDHIRPLLRQTFAQVQAPGVRLLLEQYCQVLETL